MALLSCHAGHHDWEELYLWAECFRWQRRDDRRQCQTPEQCVGLRWGHAGRSCLLRPVCRLHQRDQSPQRDRAAKRVQANPSTTRSNARGNCTVICGHTIGSIAFVGAGAVVTTDVPAYGLMLGNPARWVGWMCRCGVRLPLEGALLACSACGATYRQKEDILSLPTGFEHVNVLSSAEEVLLQLNTLWTTVFPHCEPPLINPQR